MLSGGSLGRGSPKFEKFCKIYANLKISENVFIFVFDGYEAHEIF